MKKQVDKSLVRVFGTPECVHCKTVCMVLANEGVKYEYIDILDDDYHQQRLANLVGDFSVPKIEYGDTILNYSPSKLHELIDEVKGTA